MATTKSHGKTQEKAQNKPEEKPQAKAHGHGDTHGHGGGDHHEGPHIVPNGVYVAVWIILMILTAVTVWTAKHDYGSLNIVIAMIIASVKATIVALYFMHLKYEDKLTWTFAAYPLFLLALLIGLTWSDVFYRINP